jgi:spore maturation protein CgeB
MRSLELPAMGGCMVVEDTDEHRSLFGPEGEAVLYYAGTDEMLRKVRWLKADPALAVRLGQAAHRLITSGKHTYADRLRSMLGMAC